MANEAIINTIQNRICFKRESDTYPKSKYITKSKILVDSVDKLIVGNYYYIRRITNYDNDLYDKCKLTSKDYVESQGKVDLIFDKEDGTKMEFARSIDGDVSGVYMEEFWIGLSETMLLNIFKFSKHRFNLSIDSVGRIKSIKKEM